MMFSERFRHSFLRNLNAQLHLSSENGPNAPRDKIKQKRPTKKHHSYIKYWNPAFPNLIKHQINFVRSRNETQSVLFRDWNLWVSGNQCFLLTFVISTRWKLRSPEGRIDNTKHNVMYSPFPRKWNSIFDVCVPVGKFSTLYHFQS